MAQKKSGLPLLQRGMRGYLCFMLLLFPLLPAFFGYDRITGETYLLLLVSTAVPLFLAVFLPPELALTGNGTVRALWKPFCRLDGTRIFLLLYLGWSLLSALCSEESGVWIGSGRYEGLLTIACYVFLFWAVSSYGTWDGRLLGLVGLVIAVNTVLGVLQYGGYNPLGMFPENTQYHDAFLLYNGAFLGTLGNVDLLSAFLCLTVPLFYGAYALRGRAALLLPLGLGQFLLTVTQVDAGRVGMAGMLVLSVPLMFCRTDRAARSLQAIGVLLLAGGAGRLLRYERETGLYLSPGKAALLLLIAGAALLAAGLLLGRRKPREGDPRRRFRLLLALTAALLLAALLLVWLTPFSSGVLKEVHEVLHGNFDPAFGSGRLRIWQETLPLIAERPLLGGGPDTLGSRLELSFSRYIEAAGSEVEVFVDTAHNDFLNIAVNQGLPALLFYAAALVCWFRKLLCGLKTAPEALLFLPAALAYLIQICFSFSLCSVSPLFWILLGLGDSAVQGVQTREEKTI